MHTVRSMVCPLLRQSGRLQRKHWLMVESVGIFCPQKFEICNGVGYLSPCWDEFFHLLYWHWNLYTLNCIRKFSMWIFVEADLLAALCEYIVCGHSYWDVGDATWMIKEMRKMQERCYLVCCNIYECLSQPFVCILIGGLVLKPRTLLTCLPAIKFGKVLRERIDMILKCFALQ